MNLALELQHTDEYQRLDAMINCLDSDGDPKMAWACRAIDRIRSEGKRLGVFSGSFNPLTVAHVKMIEESQAQFGFEEILLCLAKSNVDKGVFGFSLADRLFMLNRFAAQRGDFSVAVCSHGRYVDKIQAMKTAYPPRTEYLFVTGYDTLVRLFDSKYYADMHAELKPLFDRCRFITANRKEYSVDAIRRFLSKPELKCYARNIDVIELSDAYTDISSTAIRERLQRKAPIDNLVPAAIHNYIKAATVDSPDEAGVESGTSAP